VIRLHTYPDGRTGFAAFCDVCGEQITEGDGYVVWKGHDDNDQPFDVLIVHQARCDPGHEPGYHDSMPLDVEIVYLAGSAGVDLAAAIEHARNLGGSLG
jgi:hypothetical protein